jgi:hypothetical protein
MWGVITYKLIYKDSRIILSFDITYVMNFIKNCNYQEKGTAWSTNQILTGYSISDLKACLFLRCMC